MKKPDRTEVECLWSRVASGLVSREEAHEYSKVWVESSDPEQEMFEDRMVYSALLYLHGFDLVYVDPDRKNLSHHRPPGEYAKSLDEVTRELLLWRSQCVEYDIHPNAWLAKRIALAEAVAAKEGGRRKGLGGR